MTRINRTTTLVPDSVPVAGAHDLRTGASITSQRRYRLDGQIAEGGMGMIYRAHDTSLRRDVALKFLKPGVPQVDRERFAREARIGASMSHPNLVPVFDRGMLPDGGEWMAMELLEGGDLFEVMRAHGILGVPLLIDIFAQVLDVLAYVHAREIVHRDIKPENLFVIRDARCRRITVVKLLDFGIALDRTEATQHNSMLVGDPRYMAPEQTVLDVDVDPRADLYALGVCLYEAATGRHPLYEQLDGPTMGLLFAHREGGFAPPSRYLPSELPRRFARAFDHIVESACAVDPDHRYPSAQHFLEELEALVELAEPPQTGSAPANDGGGWVRIAS